MAVILSTASGKGGVGKTLITASLGITLSRLGKKVLLIDGDMGLRNMDLILGMENDCFYNICDLAEGACFLEDAVLPRRNPGKPYFRQPWTRCLMISTAAMTIYSLTAPQAWGRA